MTVEQSLRVTSIRSQNPRGFGGCIFSGKPIDDEGRIQDAGAYYVVKATRATLGGAQVLPGQWWKVSGEPFRRFIEVNGYQVSEWQIDATSAFLARPSGEHIVAFMADSPAFEGILASRRNGPGSTKTLNAICQARLTSGAQPLMTWSDEHESRVHTGIHVGDPLLCTRNLWGRGLQNGSIGTVVQIEDEPRRLTGEAGEELGPVIAWVEWDDGVRRPIVEEMLDDLELGYAITVHKAQGSQWPRVIVPVTGNRLLDRTLMYTAVTRAQRQVILVGDEQAARQAVVGLPRAQLRHVALGHALRRMLNE